MKNTIMPAVSELVSLVPLHPQTACKTMTKQRSSHEIKSVEKVRHGRRRRMDTSETRLQSKKGVKIARAPFFLCGVSTQKHLHQFSEVRGYFSLHRRMLTFCDFLRHPVRISAHTAPLPSLLSSDDRHQTTAAASLLRQPPCHALCSDRYYSPP